MERKRKLPARAAARVDHVSKKRTGTPPERSLTPVPASATTTTPVAAPVQNPAHSENIPEEPQLPKSIQAGHPLPTVEHPQPDDLMSRDYQSIQESGVVAESLSRSRQKWIHEGIFEKYWTKPTKRKGVVKEDPSNPPKDSMAKIGQVTITVEPHVLEATMYAVKDPKHAPTTNSTFRPIMQYGPPKGVMPPPKLTAPSTPITSTASPASPSHAPAQSSLQPPSAAQVQTPTQTQQSDLQRPSSSTPVTNKPLASPRGLESVLAAPQHPPALPPTAGPSSQPAPPQSKGHPQPGSITNRQLHAPSPPAPTAVATSGAKPSAPAAKPATPTAPGADPIIVTLAERASEDPQLRDLMKRVAIGDAAPNELAHFQKIIDQITADYKRKGGQHGPSADRLLVDGRTVKYFADEVRTILDIILASNPQQRSIDLRAPPGSDPLVILLVKKALDDATTRDIVRRIAEGKTKFTDATDLKATLDKLKDLVAKETPKSQQATVANGTENSTIVNGTTSRKASLATPSQPIHASSSQQALRSKGPPPSAKPDISAVVLEFSGGTGDRYLFPKYSILEYANPTQIIASFLIVRKGSRLEYGGDPVLDYYQPVTVRIFAQSSKHLENLTRVVAPQDDVRRYMDDVMDNMTRAEYVLLAMRLPRADKEDQAEENPNTPKADLSSQPQQPGVLWAGVSKTTAVTPPQKTAVKPLGDDEQYQNFVATVS
ncbi:uncharacterized protein GGS22DRAFT_51061 [Annulohypoxylon maeteangense]|uniref:uncharacterized protein n=1 Tax=Annulohypoxylon maeteangense TaxID=1927788 RepID=UPI002008B7D5|nr:uncharacterized protein GGS22DRAFT_51061 [Annulohypoxylon maeteangense]KAI0882386.1 hypothetical protein GGS22DRAFT_51061 [Annulohypoxylon maeteangense]